MIEGIDGTEEWMAEWRNKGDEGRIGLLLCRSVVEGKGGMLWESAEVVGEYEISDAWYLGPCLRHLHPSSFLSLTFQSSLSFLAQLIHNN